MEPLAGTQHRRQITGSDRDYVVFVLQLRRYLYGGLSEAEVRRFERGAIPPMSFKGLMSFYPLVSDNEQLEALDEWIETRTWLALQRRAKLLAGYTPPTVWTLDRDALRAFRTTSSRTGRPVDLRLPSARRISSLINAAVHVHGLTVVTRSSRLYLYEEGVRDADQAALGPRFDGVSQT
jgi:hypothetical protein